MLPCLAKASIQAVTERGMGAIRTGEGTGLWCILRKRQVGLAGGCSSGRSGSDTTRSIHSTSAVTRFEVASAMLSATVMTRVPGYGSHCLVMIRALSLRHPSGGPATARSSVGIPHPLVPVTAQPRKNVLPGGRIAR